MHLNSLYIHNFRSLEDFEVKKLGQLNLIVGKNNSGKSAILEALRIYAGNANRALLKEIAEQHDEKHSPEQDENDGFLPFESFFSGRCFSDSLNSKSIVIGASAEAVDALKLRHGYLIEKEETIENSSGETTTRIRQQHLSKTEISGLFPLIDSNISQALRVEKNKSSYILRLDESTRRRLSAPSLEDHKPIPCSYIPTQFVSQDELADEWDKIALSDLKEHTKIILNFIEDDFEDIAFVKNENAEEYRNYPGTRRALRRYAKIKMRNIQPVPLNSMGDGMFRVLQLSLKLFPAKGGFLLVDEFENGLHFSIQEKIWKWLFDLAEQLQIQVFATTHSWDCVESFINVTLNKDNLNPKGVEGVLFRVGRSVRTSDKGKVIATEFDKEKLSSIKQMYLEVR